jgi:uncharacterized repeat protein (TIGR03803 family)
MQHSMVISIVAVSFACITPAAAKPVLTVLQDLTYSDGGSPENPPIIGTNGVLYGTTYSSETGGGIYSIGTNGKNFAVLYEFPGGADGAGPFGQLAEGPGGVLYGTTLFAGTSGQGTVFQFAPATQTLTVLHAFDVADGATPYAGVVQDKAGNLYGTTSAGGANNFGTIYKIAAGTQTFSKLADLDGASGSAPYTPLLIGPDGYLYGTASGGGTSNDGTIFRLSPQGGKIKLLYSFSGADGNGPFSGLTAGKHGLLYGTTDAGGTDNVGVVFAFDPKSRQLKVLHSFSRQDGAGPQGKVALDKAGRLLGTTFYGGTNDSGVIYQYDPATSSFQVLENLVYSVAGTVNAGLTYGGGKVFYGGTLSGGTEQYASGTIFKFSE